MSIMPEKILSSLALARSTVYALEWIPTKLLGVWLSGGDELPSGSNLKYLAGQLRELHEREARLIKSGVYPLAAVEWESPLTHLRNYAGVLADGLRVGWRMRQKDHDDFSAAARDHAEGLPEYYTRNFHFQTDGYLSERSARLYDHQVEILFGGTAGAMRRQILPVLKRHAHPRGKYLDLGAGAGSSTRPVLATFPRARVTALDLSGPYLKVAQERLRDQARVDFVQGDATDLNYQDGSFDAVFSVFVMHELPSAERAKLVREAYRVLKPGGILIIADSLQTGDEPRFDRALALFPRVYHEPFFANYLREPLEALLSEVTGQEAGRELALFAKVAWVLKPL